MGHLSRQGVMVAGFLGVVLLGAYWLMRPSGDNAPAPEGTGADVPVQSVAGDRAGVDFRPTCDGFAMATRDGRNGSSRRSRDGVKAGCGTTASRFPRWICPTRL